MATKAKDGNGNGNGNKAVALIEPAMFDLSIALQGAEELRDNIDQIDIRLPVIKIIHQAQMFEMPPDSRKVQSFTGMILDFNRIQSYWPKDMNDEAGVPPSCFSLDAVRPSPFSEHLESDFCAQCPKNVFGSSLKGRGKACKSIKRVHVTLEPTQFLPFRLVLPPSNIKAFDDYISRLVSVGYPWRMVQTEFALKAVKNKDGITYSELVCTPVGSIGKEQSANSKLLADNFMPILRDLNINRQDIGE